MFNVSHVNTFYWLETISFNVIQMQNGNYLLTYPDHIRQQQPLYLDYLLSAGADHLNIYLDHHSDQILYTWSDDSLPYSTNVLIIKIIIMYI